MIILELEKLFEFWFVGLLLVNLYAANNTPLREMHIEVLMVELSDVSMLKTFDRNHERLLQSKNLVCDNGSCLAVFFNQWQYKYKWPNIT